MDFPIYPPRLFRPLRLFYFEKISDPPFYSDPPTIRDLRVLIWGDLSRNLLAYKAKQKKMFVCENPGGQKNIHQAGRESNFFA